jgi:hypothetical protein
MVILKKNRGGYFDECKSMKSLKDSYTLWKTKAMHPEYFCLQRFIIPFEDVPSKIRTFYNVKKAQILFRIVKNFKKTRGKTLNSKVRGWDKLKNFTVTTQTLDNEDKYLVKSLPEQDVYEDELRNQFLIDQVKTLRKVIEYCECSDKNFEVTEIVADFIQDNLGKWYFLNVVNYKLEFVVNQRQTPLPKMKRLIRSSYSLINFKKRSKTQSQVFPEIKKDPDLSSQETLTNEIIKALSSPKNTAEKTTKELYCKAYHLKIT